MTTPPPVQISDEMVRSASRVLKPWLYEDPHCVEHMAAERARFETEVAAAVEAVAPLIAAQVLRDHGPCGHTTYGLLARMVARMPLICSRPTGHEGAHGDAWGAQWTQIEEPENGRERSPAAGRCGDRAPTVLEPDLDAQLPAIICALPHGHQGWHRDDRGAEWGELSPAAGGVVSSGTVWVGEQGPELIPVVYCPDDGDHGRHAWGPPSHPKICLGRSLTEDAP